MQHVAATQPAPASLLLVLAKASAGLMMPSDLLQARAGGKQSVKQPLVTTGNKVRGEVALALTFTGGAAAVSRCCLQLRAAPQWPAFHVQTLRPKRAPIELGPRAEARLVRRVVLAIACWLVSATSTPVAASCLSSTAVLRYSCDLPHVHINLGMVSSLPCTLYMVLIYV